MNQRFNFSGGNGTYEGEFTSFNTANGTFSYNNGGCLASGTWTAEIPAPGPFSKISPVDGAIGLPPSSLPLRWEASAQADSYEYCYDATDDNACENWISAASETLVNIEGLSPETTYYWQVRAVSNVGSTYANGTLTAFWPFTTGELSAWTWTQMTATAGWTPRSIHTSVALPDGSIVLMGGYDGVHDYFNDVWRSTDQGATWMQMTGSAEWSARSAHSSVVLPDGSIVLMGGSDSTNHFNDVWRSTDQGASWTQMTATAEWAARDYLTSVALSDGSIVLMGGYDGTTRFNDVWRSTDQGATWQQLTAAQSGRRATVTPAWSCRTAASC